MAASIEGVDFRKQAPLDPAGLAPLYNSQMVNTWQEGFGARLKEARLRAGHTQDSLAEAIHLESKQSISHWEVGRNTPALSALIAVAKELAVSIDWLVFGDTAAVSPEALDLASQYDRLSAIERAQYQEILNVVRHPGHNIRPLRRPLPQRAAQPVAPYRVKRPPAKSD
jgi:transcriptional regulator with XRE-family HTH domain